MTQAKQTTNHAAEATEATIADLSHETAITAYHVASRVREASDKLTQELVEASLASHESGARAAREYLGSLAKARQEWSKKAGEVAERALSVSPTAIDYPLTRGIETFNASVLENTKRALEFYTAPFTVAAKR